MNHLSNLIKFANGDDLNDHEIEVLCKNNYIDEKKELTSSSFELLKKFRAKNLIINAAGKGSRLSPLTKTVAKPLIKVNSKPIIEYSIEAAISKLELDEIIIVVWWLKEQFNYLVDKYKDKVKIRIVENYEADTKNNISTFDKVKDYVGNSYIIDGDIIIDPSLFEKYVMKNTFWAKYSKDYTKEWMLNLDESGIVCDVSIGGQENCYMSGLCFINKSGAKILNHEVVRMYATHDHNEYYWENLIINRISDLFFCVKKIEDEQIIEFDNLEELSAYDHSYDIYNYDDESYLKKTVHEVFNVTTDKIKNIKKISGGITNKSMMFELDSEKYIFRTCFTGVNDIIDRSKESVIYDILSKYDLCEKVIYFNKEDGTKISRFVDSIRLSQKSVNENISVIASSLKCLHEKKIDLDYSFNPLEELLKYESSIESEGISFYDNYLDIREIILNRYNELFSSFNYAFCHNDLIYGNILIEKSSDKALLIDWEYSGVNDIAFDIASLFSENEITDENQCVFWDVYQYNDNIKERVDFWIDFQNLLWSIWHLYCKNYDNIDDDEYGIKRFNKLLKKWGV